MTYKLRDLNPVTDFLLLAEWFTLLEGQVNTESGLNNYWGKHKDHIFTAIAVDQQGEQVGFYWALINKFQPDKVTLYLYVNPRFRCKGIGNQLFDDVFKLLIRNGCREFKCNVPEEDPDGLVFMSHRGFEQILHSIAMRLDFKDFDDAPYQPNIATLEDAGFQFTSMEKLGNTIEAQQKLYILNDTTVMDTPLWRGGHCWNTFEEFQSDVCNQEWFKPGGQMVVIDNSTGAWVAMSAITQFRDSPDAYNLFTGVEKHYRGKKLAQVVKVLALKYARDVLKTPGVRTNHNTANSPMITIDEKFGYQFLPGSFAMLKKI